MRTVASETYRSKRPHHDIRWQRSALLVPRGNQTRLPKASKGVTADRDDSFVVDPDPAAHANNKQ